MINQLPGAVEQPREGKAGRRGAGVHWLRGLMGARRMQTLIQDLLA